MVEAAGGREAEERVRVRVEEDTVDDGLRILFPQGLDRKSVV